MDRLAKYSEHVWTLLRIVAGVLFSCHGAQKLFGMFGGFHGQKGATAPLLSLMGLAGVIELLGGLLIAVGLFTRPAAFIASGQMAAAYFMAHATRAFWPLQNHGELAVLYCFLFFFLFFRGAGRFSLDHAIHQRGAVAVPAH
jgi:putative oxidoreductase